MKHCPSHVEDSLVDATERFAEDIDKYHHYFQLVCGCGESMFHLLRSDKTSVKGECNSCGKTALIYDLANYPAAFKPKGKESYSSMEGVPLVASHVYVGYEYGELDEDQKFDRNDITWCQIFVETESGDLVRVFDDETA